MTEPETVLAARPVPHDPDRCDCRPWCPFCGGVMVDEGDRVVCVSCGTDAVCEAAS